MHSLEKSNLRSSMKYCHSPLFFRSIRFSLFLFFERAPIQIQREQIIIDQKQLKNSNSKSSEIKTLKKKAYIKVRATEFRKCRKLSVTRKVDWLYPSWRVVFFGCGKTLTGLTITNFEHFLTSKWYMVIYFMEIILSFIKMFQFQNVHVF